MNWILAKLKLNRRLNLQINARGWLSVLVVVVMALVVGVNLWKVAVNAAESIDVFQAEQESLSALRQIHQDLQDQLSYYESYEYKKLYARDNLRLVEPGERLFRVLSPIEYFEFEEVTPNFFAETDNLSWWLELL